MLGSIGSIVGSDYYDMPPRDWVFAENLVGLGFLS